MIDSWRRPGGAFVRVGVVALLVGCVALSTGCSGAPEVSLDADPSEFEDEVRALQARVSENPKDAEALRDLGAIYMRTGRASRGYDRLKKAFARDPNDPKTLYFLGLASEQVGKREAALEVFKRFERVPESSDYRALMEGRYEWLVRKQAESDIKAMLARESELSDAVSPRVVAVLPLQHQGSQDKYAPLGRGLAEMMISDLTKIDRLRLVERIRLQALLDELKLAQSDYVDPSTAPRVGRLLGAGRLVTGSYIVTSDDRLRVDATLAEIDSEVRFPNVGTRFGPLSDLFELQNELTLRVVDALGVELTPQERESLDDVPTRDLQAFLAYSQGLQDEDRGHFGAAARHYRRAAEIDPSFQAPAVRQRKAQGLNAAGGSAEAALGAALRSGRSRGMHRRVGRRLRNMGVGVVGPIGRRAVEESGTATESLLRIPPPPPRRDP